MREPFLKLAVNFAKSRVGPLNGDFIEVTVIKADSRYAFGFTRLMRPGGQRAPIAIETRFHGSPGVRIGGFAYFARREGSPPSGLNAETVIYLPTTVSAGSTCIMTLPGVLSDAPDLFSTLALAIEGCGKDHALVIDGKVTTTSPIVEVTRLSEDFFTASFFAEEPEQ